MTSSVSGIASVIAAILWQFGLIIVVSAIVAFFVAHRCAGTSRRKRQAIYSMVGFVGIIIGLMVTIHRLAECAMRSMLVSANPPRPDSLPVD